MCEHTHTHMHTHTLTLSWAILQALQLCREGVRWSGSWCSLLLAPLPRPHSGMPSSEMCPENPMVLMHCPRRRNQGPGVKLGMVTIKGAWAPLSRLRTSVARASYSEPWTSILMSPEGVVETRAGVPFAFVLLTAHPCSPPARTPPWSALTCAGAAPGPAGSPSWL